MKLIDAFDKHCDSKFCGCNEKDPQFKWIAGHVKTLCEKERAIVDRHMDKYPDKHLDDPNLRKKVQEHRHFCEHCRDVLVGKIIVWPKCRSCDAELKELNFGFESSAEDESKLCKQCIHNETLKGRIQIILKEYSEEGIGSGLKDERTDLRWKIDLLEADILFQLLAYEVGVERYSEFFPGILTRDGGWDKLNDAQQLIYKIQNMLDRYRETMND